MHATIGFVRDAYANLENIISICIGAGIVVRAGVLDGKKATTNKAAWNQTALGPKVNWIAHARWIQDGNVWSTAGITAGMDGTMPWVEKVVGQEVADGLALRKEYARAVDWRDDPFADHGGLKDVLLVA